jgi:hypothetical protein
MNPKIFYNEIPYMYDGIGWYVSFNGNQYGPMNEEEANYIADEIVERFLI